MVCISIGFWAFNLYDCPYALRQELHLKKAIGCARRGDIKAMIDVHGIPSSENGFDNSGQRLDKPQREIESSYQEALNVVLQVAKKYSVPE